MTERALVLAGKSNTYGLLLSEIFIDLMPIVGSMETG